MPIVLNRAGEALNCGREHRVANRAQRRALRAMYRTCGYPGCDVVFDRCDIHHVIEWLRHGSTDLHNLLPLCSTHHHLVHEGRWRLTLDKHRVITIHRPDGTRHFHGTTINRTSRARGVGDGSCRGSPTGQPTPLYRRPSATHRTCSRSAMSWSRGASLQERDQHSGGCRRAAAAPLGGVSSLSSHVRHRRRCEPAPDASSADLRRAHRRTDASLAVRPEWPGGGRGRGHDARAAWTPGVLALADRHELVARSRPARPDRCVRPRARPSTRNRQPGADEIERRSAEVDRPARRAVGDPSRSAPHRSRGRRLGGTRRQP